MSFKSVEEKKEPSCDKRAAVWMGIDWRRQNVYEWHQDETLKVESGALEIGLKTLESSLNFKCKHWN